MPTRENAFDFEDNPSGSDDKLPRISRRLKTPNTVASIVAMPGNATLAVGTMNDRNQRCNRRNRNRLAHASDKSPNTKDKKRELSEAEKKREKQNHERDAREKKIG